MKNYEIKIKELENGNGYIYGIGMNGAVGWERPNEDIGETYENQIGFSSVADAVAAASKVLNSLVVSERYEQEEKERQLLEQM